MSVKVKPVKARKTTPATIIAKSNAKRLRTDEDDEEDGSDSEMVQKIFGTTKKANKKSVSKSASFYGSDEEEDNYQTDGGYETETATRRRRPVGGGGVAKSRRGKAKSEGKQGVVESMINRSQTAMASIEKQTLTGLLLLTDELAGAILQPGNETEIDRIIELLREHRTHDADDSSRKAMLASIALRDSLASVLKTLILDGLDGSNDKTEEDLAIKRDLIQTGGAKGNSVTFVDKLKMAHTKLTTGDRLKISQEQAAASAAAASSQRKPQEEEDIIDLQSGNESDPPPRPPRPQTATQKALTLRQQPPQPPRPPSPVPTPVAQEMSEDTRKKMFEQWMMQQQQQQQQATQPQQVVPVPKEEDEENLPPPPEEEE